MRRVIVAGTHSGSGKTTVTFALMRALTARGQSVAPFKVGPDYIDPGFHRFVCEMPSYNLDGHLMSEAAINRTLIDGMRGADIGVIEGVMGYYDGMGDDFAFSTFDMARQTRTPVLLVVDAAGSAVSAAAVALGFQQICMPSGISGVIVNRVSSERHYTLVRNAVEQYTGLRCVGYLPKDASLNLSSRHLGLIPAQEVEDLRARVDRAASLLKIDWEAFETIVADCDPLHALPMKLIPNMNGYRLGVARDEAFHFYYQSNLDLLEASGAQLVYFSPLRDALLPENLDGLYIGGGFPEVFAQQLSQNEAMRHSLQDALENGLYCYAECGGLLYLCDSIEGNEMVGFFSAICRMTERLQRFGYTWVDFDGARYPAHEFHHSMAEPHEDIETAFAVQKAGAPEKTWRCGYHKKNTIAGFPHLHFTDHPELAARLFGRAKI